VTDQESPQFGSSKSRAAASFSFLRGRRSGDSDGLISFNLMPQESADEDAPPVPGRVSQTRLLMVHYWRRDQRAMAEAERRLADAAAALDSDPSSVSSQPVSASSSPAAFPMETSPAAAMDTAAQAPTLDPNRQDFLSSLKSRRQRPSVSAPAEAAWSPLVIELPSSTKSAEVTGEAARGADLGASLFVEPGAPPAPAAEKPKSIFEPRPRETVSAAHDVPSVFAHEEAEPQPIVEPLIVESPAALTNEPAADLMTEPEPVSAHEPEPVSAHVPASQGRQAKIRALESFLKRVEQRRQQIESQSVA
jgi:hypothetical protein